MNGCTTFHINDIDKICEKYKVDDFMKQEVIDMHKTMEIISESELLELVKDLNIQNDIIQVYIIGNNTYKLNLLSLLICNNILVDKSKGNKNVSCRTRFIP